MRRFALWSITSLLLAPQCVAEPIAQAFTNNAPFSGAIYIVDPNGQQVTAQGTNYCPSSASVSCSTVNMPSWCCPANYVCVSPTNANGLIGCCPNGQSCGGVVAQATTMTVYPQQQTAVVYANPAPATTVVVNNHPTQAQSGFCATVTMTGPDLPRAAQGQCGTILLVAGATSLSVFGVGSFTVAMIMHTAFARLFHRG